MYKMNKKKFSAKPEKGKHDEKKVRLDNGEVEVFECENCKFEKEEDEE